MVPVHAQQVQLADLDKGFDPNAILSDSDIFDANAFPMKRMVDFLRSKGTLADAKQVDTDGVMKPIADIVWRVSQSYKINPKYLLALMQKEQSLVEDPDPSQKQFDWATGYGVCDTCSMSDPSVQQFKGFASQIEWSAKQFREKYLMQILGKGSTLTGIALGKTVMVDGLAIKPANNATAMLYTYTPHIHGNLNLWRIWTRWFSITYPDGTIVRAKTSKKTYLVRLGEKHLFASPAVTESMVDESKVILVDDTDLQGYPDGDAIKFPNYALLRDPHGTIYLLSGDEKRPIESMKTFLKLGFNEDEILDVQDSDLASYTVGDKITAASAYPQGVLLKVATQPGVWYVESGTRHALVSDVFLKLYFRNWRIHTVTQKTLDQYTVGDPYQLHDGELVKAKDTSSIYVVENGVLRPIPSADVFESVGWSWGNIVTIPSNVLTTYHVGDPFMPTTTQPVTTDGTQVAQASL